MNKIVAKIQDKLADKKDVLSELGNLSNSELNSFLLELFRIRSLKVDPTEIVNQFKENRFVAPSETDIVKQKQIEIECLEHVQAKGYKTVNLSPVTPFGTSSAVGMVNQNNVISALRGAEVVSDATNVLALKMASEFKKLQDKNSISRYATTHRHIRGQYFSNPNFTAHFSVLCLASSGFDKGNYEFELTQLEEQLAMLYKLLEKQFQGEPMYIKLFAKENSEQFQSLLQNRQESFWADKEIIWFDDFDNKYYKTIQFKIGVKKGNQSLEIADGGDVDWTQKLLGNRKHRMFISGLGIDLMEKV